MWTILPIVLKTVLNFLILKNHSEFKPGLPKNPLTPFVFVKEARKPLEGPEKIILETPVPNEDGPPTIRFSIVRTARRDHKKWPCCLSFHSTPHVRQRVEGRN